MHVQWEFCAARGDVIGDDKDATETAPLSDAALLALGAAHMKADFSGAARAAYTSEQCFRVAL
jgi:hypothetical protein